MKKYGLIGETLKHSFSPMLHHEFGNKEYDLIEIPKTEIQDYMKDACFEAINVTIPYKETVIPFCELDETAKTIGAVNTIVNKDGKLFGYNTDHLGFNHMLKRANIEMKNKKVVILGSGGTSKTACYAAAKNGASSIVVVSRGGTKYPMDVDCPVSFTTYEKSQDYLDAGILVNTTPVGMYPDNESVPVDLDLFTNLEGVVDVIYNPLTTMLVKKATHKGIKATNGLPMLVAQAYYAEKLFFGEPTDIDDKAVKSIEEALLKLTMLKKNIVLIGMPGCGKTTTGKALSKKLGMELVDTDDEFTALAGMNPGNYILEHGEEAFRKLESDIVKKVAGRSGIIIATGGGAILKQENVDALSLNGAIVYLHTQLKHLATEGRPLSQGDEKRKALYYKRLPIYLAAKDKLVDVVESGEVTADRVIEAVYGPENNKKKILVINGSNLNMLGIREPDIYGRKTYQDLMKYIEDEAKKLNVDVEFVQSNHEGDLVDAIQNAYGRKDGIVINPGAYTHTSVAILDAVKAVGIPTIEVHISDVDSREDFRQISYIRKAAKATISGHGFEGYVMAIKELVK